ncbi:MAG: DUF937 domain-containing protein [Blastomonas sp.]
MDIMDIIQKSGGLESIAGELGVDKSVAKSGAEALLPAIMGGFKKNAQGSGGIGDLVGMIGGLGGGDLLKNVVSSGPTDVGKGNEILGQIFGSKDVSRSVAGKAAEQTGVDPSILKKMLPMLSMLVAGYMANQAGGGSAKQSGGGGLGSLLGGLLGGGKKSASGGGLGGLASMLDMDGDGNPLDDLMGMVGKLSK